MKFYSLSRVITGEDWGEGEPFGVLLRGIFARFALTLTLSRDYTGEGTRLLPEVTDDDIPKP